MSIWFEYADFFPIIKRSRHK